MTTKLLAVDDSKTMRKVLEITFAGDTYDSTVVGSADEALAAVRSNPPQVVVVDGYLGRTSGYDLCKQIKEELPTVKVLLLSSKQRPYDAGVGAACGVDEYFDKPFDSTKFLDKLGGLQVSAAAAPQPAAAAQRPALPPETSTQVERPQISQPAAPMRPIAAAAPAAAPKPMSVPARQPAPATRAAAPAVVAAAPQAPPRPTAAVVPAKTPSTTAPSTTAPSTTALSGAGTMAEKLEGLGLTKEQILGVLALSREVVEQVVWEVVPVLAEAMIKEEIERLTAE